MNLQSLMTQKVHASGGKGLDVFESARDFPRQPTSWRMNFGDDVMEIIQGKGTMHHS